MMKRAFDSNPEDMLDDIHGEIMDVVHEAGGEIERSLDKAEQDFQHWWAGAVGTPLPGITCAYHFEEGHEGDKDYIAWDNHNASTECAVPYDEYG